MRSGGNGGVVFGSERSEMEMGNFVVLFLFILHSAVVCTGSSIAVDPPTHQFMAINSTENVTFICNVTGSSTRDAVWAVQQRQIPNDQDTVIRRNFAGIGVFIEVLEPGITALIITSQARMFYLNETPTMPNITVMCASFTGTSGEEGDLINITTFG